MAKKQCKECLKEKSLDNFYGLQGECKECTKKRVREREIALRENPEWVQREKARNREKYFRLYKGIKQDASIKKKAMKNYFEKYPEKRLAQNSSQHLSKKGFQIHHWSYNPEHYKDVIYLSKIDHAKLHRYMIYDQERKMYRRCDTMELLDTKESHLEYFKKIKNKP